MYLFLLKITAEHCQWKIMLALCFLILSGCKIGRLMAHLGQSKYFTKAIGLVICD